jgi:zinc/manganese transport system substrate-binding protein
MLPSLLALAAAVPATAALRVVTTTPDHAALVREVAGPLASVESLASGRQNAHHIDPKPSHVLKTMKADLFIENGLELEVGWAGSVLSAARNKRVMPGAPGHLDASQAVEPLEVPDQGELSRAHGDVHPGGNPHYTQDPARGPGVSPKARRARPGDGG